MQFIKTLFWVVLAVVLVVFAVNNWSPVSVIIWEDIRADTKLPVLVIGAFLLGFLPLWLLHRTQKWRLTRRIRTLEEAARPKTTVTPTPVPVAKPVDPVGNPVADPAPKPTAKPAVSPVGEAKASDA